jgi:hypothetical protein
MRLTLLLICVARVVADMEVALPSPSPSPSSTVPDDEAVQWQQFRTLCRGNPMCIEKMYAMATPTFETMECVHELRRLYGAGSLEEYRSAFAVFNNCSLNETLRHLRDALKEEAASFKKIVERVELSLQSDSGMVDQSLPLLFILGICVAILAWVWCEPAKGTRNHKHRELLDAAKSNSRE